jgi:hypothetical protein
MLKFTWDFLDSKAPYLVAPASPPPFQSGSLPSVCAAAGLLGPGEPLRWPENLSVLGPSALGLGADPKGHFSARSVP